MKNTEFPFGSDLHEACLAKIDYLDDDAAAKLANFTKKPKDFLLYLGSPGTGKSYFCAAMKNFVEEKKKQCLYLTSYDFYKQLRDVINRGWDYQYELEKITQIEYVIVDDIKFGDASSEKNDWRNEVLFTLLDLRSSSRLPTVVTSNSYLKDIKKIAEPRVYSRLAAIRNTIIERNDQDLRQIYS